MSAPIRIVLADDHPIFRRGLVQVLQAEPDFEIAAECGDGGKLGGECGDAAAAGDDTASAVAPTAVALPLLFIGDALS